MTVLTFPSNPTEGQIYDAPNGIQYVYDGVKWAGETTTSSSEAVTGATQDRVAPMFVNGNNDGITFAYDDVTNTMSATVTSTVGDTLSNNSHEFTLESDGTLTLDGEPFAIPDVSNFITSEDIPAIPTNTNQLVNGAGFITLSDVPAGFSGSYDDLTNKPTIPTDVNDLTDTDGLLSGGSSNTIEYTDEETGYQSQVQLTYDFDVDVDNAHLNINGSGSWNIGSSNFETEIFSTTNDDGNDPIDIVVRANDNDWTFKRDGSIIFPDGTTQTTAYTGTGSTGSRLYAAVNNDGRVFTSTDGLSWTEYTTTMDGVGRVAVGPDMIVFTADAVDASNGEDDALWYATTDAPGTVTEVTGFDDFILNQVKYFANIEKFVAVGRNTSNLPVILYSSNGTSWTQVDLDSGFLAAFNSGAGYTNNAEFSDIETNGTGFLLVTSDINLGAFYTTDITTPMGSSNWIDLSGPGLDDNFGKIAYATSGAFTGWHLLQDDDTADDAWYYNSSTDPRNGSFTEFFEDIGSIFAESVNYQPDISEVVFGSYQGATTIMVATTDGQILYWPAVPEGPFVSIPKPYTATDFSINQSTTAAITFGAKSANTNEKIVLSNCTPSDYNGTYYVDSGNVLYTDSSVSQAFDTSGFGAFVSGTITFSHGQYIDALHYSDGVFYAGNDDEEMFVSTNGGATWTLSDTFTGSPGEPEYMNDIDSYITEGSNERLVNGSNELVLESNGTVTLPSGGTITEGIVTSNPTIQLTPASPSAASQKLVIKGGGNYINTENGIEVSAYNNTWAVNDSVTFYVYAQTRPNETLYWWIVPEEGGISSTPSGTVELDIGGGGSFNFTLDSDDYEFRVRVSPEQDNYDPATVGVQSVLMNPDAPTFGDHHLHLTTGDLQETSIFLGTDDHNVRTTVDGKIQITTPNNVNNVWSFDFNGSVTFPDGTVQTTAYTNPDLAFTGYLDYGSDGSDPTKFTSVRSLKPLNAIKEIQMSPEIFDTDLNQTSVRSQLEKIVNNPRESKLTLTLESDTTKVWNYAVTHIGRSDFATDYKGYTARFIRTYSDNASGIIRMIIVKGVSGTLYEKYWDPIASNDDWYVGMYGPSTVLAFTIADSTAWIRRDYEQLVRFFESIVDNVVYNGVTEITDAEQLRTRFYANINTVISDMGGNLYYNFRAYNNSRFFSGVPLTSQTSTVNAEITFDVTEAGRYQTVGITNVGAGFQVGQQITLLGSSLDAYSTTPAEQFDGIHNATVTVTAVDGSGGIIEYTVSGYGVGEWGTDSINDGEDDQFDVSHKFSTNISWVNDHSDGSSISQNSFLRYNSGFVTTGSNADDFFGSGSKYVMVSHKGVTMMAATGVSGSIEWLAITGNSGFDNDGTVDEGDVKIGNRYSLYLRCVSGPEYLPQVDERYLMSLKTTDRYGLIEVISNSYNPGSPSDNILLQSLHEGDFTVKGNDELILTANDTVTIRAGSGWIASGGDADGNDVRIYGGDGFANGGDTTQFGEGGEVIINGGQGGSFAYTISAMTNASPAVVTLTRPLELRDGIQARFSGMAGLSLTDTVAYYVNQTSETQLEIYTDSDRTIPLDTTDLGSFVSGGIVLGSRDGDVYISSLGYFNGNLKLNEFVWPTNYDAVSVGQYLKVKSIEGSTPYLEFANDITTVAKTGGSATSGTILTLTPSPATNANWAELYFTDYVVADLTITFDVGTPGSLGGDGVTIGTFSASETHSVGDAFFIDGAVLGGTSGVDDLTLTVATIDPIPPTAIDLTKTVNKLADGDYTLADGVEGQIMYLVPQTGTTNDGISIIIANARVLDNGGTTTATVYTDIDYRPFVPSTGTPIANVVTLIYTDDAWQVSGGSFD